MCGRFNLIQSPLVLELMSRLGLADAQLRFNHDCAPCTPISIIRHVSDQLATQDAIWHLYLQQSGSGFKPHPKYWSINTNWQQLTKKVEFKTSRCLIPATAFVESQDGKRPHLLDFEQHPFCFGGLFKTWLHSSTGETVTSASIITLAGHEKLNAIHRKSLPLMFNHDETDQMQRWLSHTSTAVELTEFLQPSLRRRLRVVPVDKSSSKQPIGNCFFIAPDAIESSDGGAEAT